MLTRRSHYHLHCSFLPQTLCIMLVESESFTSRADFGMTLVWNFVLPYFCVWMNSDLVSLLTHMLLLVWDSFLFDTTFLFYVFWRLDSGAVTPFALLGCFRSLMKNLKDWLHLHPETLDAIVIPHVVSAVSVFRTHLF